MIRAVIARAMILNSRSAGEHPLSLSLALRADIMIRIFGKALDHLIPLTAPAASELIYRETIASTDSVSISIPDRTTLSPFCE